MKRVIPALLILCINCYCQQLFVEEFSYPAGTRLFRPPWTLADGTLYPFVTEGSLTFGNYPSDIGSNMLVLDGNTIKMSIAASFNSVSSEAVYCSFLINLKSTLELSSSSNVAGDNAFFSFANLSISRGWLFLRKSSDSTFKIGIGNKEASPPLYMNIDLMVKTTHCLVASYTLSGGTEVLRLWINPTLTGVEPEPNMVLNMATTLSSVSKIKFYQKQFTGDSYIDAIRVAESWQQAPLPVELSSFGAEVKGSRVELSWMTLSEVNNYGFEVERSYDKTEWVCIGFVNGAGNCNSERRYQAFDDEALPDRIVYYRLKQIDTDGTYTYSVVAEVKVEGKGYELYQNYPNPFNPETKIEWMQESEGTATIRIYDTAGEVVRMFAEHRSAGLQYIMFSGKGLSSGVYYYELEVGGFKERKAMTVLK